MTIEEILEKQRSYFHSGVTLPVKFRVEKLKRLRQAVQKYEKEIADALTADLGKSDYEGFMCEIGLVLGELSYMIRHTKKLASKKIRADAACTVCGGQLSAAFSVWKCPDHEPVELPVPSHDRPACGRDRRRKYGGRQTECLRTGNQ
jgi:hypothetical protein